MKYLTLFLAILALHGCENNTGGAGDNAKKADKISTSYVDKPLAGRILKYGLFKMVRSGGVVDDPNTSTGKSTAKPVIEQVAATELIPLIKGAQMYLQYRIKPFPDFPAYVDLKQVLKHPEMTLPDGSVSTGAEIPFKGKVSSNQSIGYIGYGFDEDYELVEGDWILEIWHQDKKMIEQKFITYWPTEEETTILKTKLAPIKLKGRPVRSSTTPLPEKEWPYVIVHDIGDDPILKEVVPLAKP